MKNIIKMPVLEQSKDMLKFIKFTLLGEIEENNHGSNMLQISIWDNVINLEKKIKLLIERFV